MRLKYKALKEEINNNLNIKKDPEYDQITPQIIKVLKADKANK